MLRDCDVDKPVAEVGRQRERRGGRGGGVEGCTWKKPEYVHIFIRGLKLKYTMGRIINRRFRMPQYKVFVSISSRFVYF